MEYDRIIVEMLSRIKALEEKVEELSKNLNFQDQDTKNKEPMLKTSEIKEYILQLKKEAKDNGESFLIIKANDLHKELNLKSRMPAVCNAMKQVMNDKDEVLHETKSGFSSTYLVKYYLN